MRGRLAAALALLALVTCCAPDPEPRPAPREPQPPPPREPLPSPPPAAQAYLVAVAGDVEVVPLVSVGDRVPLEGDPARSFQLVGVPDGLALLGGEDGASTLLVSHELPAARESEPVVGEPRVRGAFVSRLTLAENGSVASGALAFERVFREDVLAGPVARADNDTPAFALFCSSHLSGPWEGLDRPVLFANEETPSGGFDGLGGEAVAIFDGEAHALPGMGHLARENAVVVPDTGELTAVISLEDEARASDSQLYLHVGRKSREEGASVLERNGLVGGELYVMAAAEGPSREAAFTHGELAVAWKRLGDAAALDARGLERAADEAGAFGFVRLEDGAFDPRAPRVLYFASTGGSAGNELGRLYALELADDVLGPGRLRLLHDADEVFATGGDGPLSPDNLAASAEWLVICEDATSPARAALAAKGRDASIWRMPLGAGTVDVAGATRLASIAPPGRDGTPVPRGGWETTGIIDASASFGPSSWLVAVQAHPPTKPPGPGLVQDGQVLLLRPRP